MLFTTRPELRGTFGMVASTHWLASSAGMAVLERGGNAFDAAVATGFVLQIVEPHLNGPGGDLPAIVYSADRDQVLVVCGQGTAPASAVAVSTLRAAVPGGVMVAPPETDSRGAADSQPPSHRRCDNHLGWARHSPRTLP